MEPFFSQMNFDDNCMEGYGAHDVRHLKDLTGYYNEADMSAELEKGNPIVYEVYKREVPKQSGELLHCVTVINPGRVGAEYYMTKGHYHQDETCAEIYYGQKGHGRLVMQKGNESRIVEMLPGTIAYIPAGWGHRTVNISETEPFVFFSIWPGHSGYNYERVAKEPFVKVQAE